MPTAPDPIPRSVDPMQGESRRGNSLATWLRRMPSERLAAVAGVFLLLTGGALAAGFDRGALWAVVSYCKAQKQAIGIAFPCLEVHLDGGSEAGFAVLRAPLERSHIVVVPTRRITGIESPVLLQPGIPNYWQAAWAARDYVTGEVPRPLDRQDIGLAVNSAGGRSQDQLHIHVDCIDPAVRRILDAGQDAIGSTWTRVPARMSWHPYWVMRLEQSDLTGVNPIKMVAETLPGASADMMDETVAVLGARFRNGRDGFYLLAGRATRRNGVAIAEDLLDHACPKT